MFSDLCAKIVAFLEELIDVQNHLESIPCSWVPMDHDLKTAIFSHDGSIEGYSGTCHARSQFKIDQSFFFKNCMGPL